MKLTNKYNLPKAIVNAVKNDEYNNGGADMSVTTLIKPARIAALEEKHWDSLSEDASDRIWALMGQIGHKIMERAADETVVSERRLFMNVKGYKDQIWKISGSIDLYVPSEELIQDFKFTTAYKVKDGKCPKEWEEQLNCYAELSRIAGDPVSMLQIIAVFRDWSKMEADRNPEYPQMQCMILDVPIWPSEEARQFIKDRVIVHQKAREELPECTIQERWAKPTRYAVIKPGAPRAIKLHDTKESAEMHSEALPGTKVEERPGMNTRCEFYCSVKNYCSQYQNSLKNKK